MSNNNLQIRSRSRFNYFDSLLKVAQRTMLGNHNRGIWFREILEGYGVAPIATDVYLAFICDILV